MDKPLCSDRRPVAAARAGSASLGFYAAPAGFIAPLQPGRARRIEGVLSKYTNLIQGWQNSFDGALTFQQVPLVEIDGMKLVQCRAILNYIAGKYNLYGKDLKERAMIDIYSEGLIDLMGMIIMAPFTPAENKEETFRNIEEKAKVRFLPVFEKALANSSFLVGKQLSRADVHLLEATLMLQELFPSILATFPKIQAFQEQMKALPAISKFLQPGSARKPPPDEEYVRIVKAVLPHRFK